ncbi:hypothetical protein [uncultured Bradyrhizobium sp.]|uniref:hypothetical protein n=1 Tax=uncultured Bradyrhizobium sp. TaxID=199684 RepID=UPI0035CB43F0
MTFRINEKVLCVDDSANGLGAPVLLPERGKIYTVRAVGLVHPLDLSRLPCILIAEIDRLSTAPLWAHRFRSIANSKTSITFAHDILRAVSRKEPVHA